jgi:hypothetical protein
MLLTAGAVVGQTGAPRPFAKAPFASPGNSAAPVSTAVMPSAAPPQTFHDPKYKISFDYPSNWNFSRNDRELSTFHLDARTAPSTASLRAVAAIPENPFPASTFSGAYVYLSVIPHATDATCASQARVHRVATAPSASPAPRSSKRAGTSQFGGISFAHGHDEQKHICTTDRDEIYTTFRRGACYRFDLFINNFCGGEVSGVKDITPEELEQVRKRLEGILATVRFDPK